MNFPWLQLQWLFIQFCERSCISKCYVRFQILPFWNVFFFNLCAKFLFQTFFVKINTPNIMNQSALLTDKLISNHDIANEFGVNGNKSDRIHYLCFYNTNFLWDMNKNLQNNGIQNGKRKELSAWYENNHNCFEQRKKMDYSNACISIVCLFICFFVYIYLVFWLVLSLSLSRIYFGCFVYLCLLKNRFILILPRIFFSFCRVSFRIQGTHSFGIHSSTRFTFIKSLA